MIILKHYERNTPGSQGQALLQYSPTKSENKREAIEVGGVTKRLQIGGELAPIHKL